MALRLIAPFSCTPLLKRYPATATNSTILRSGLRIYPASDSVTCLSSNHREFSSSRGILSRTEQLGVARSQSSIVGQGVVDGEEPRAENLHSQRLVLYSKPGCCLCDGLKEKLEGSEILADFQLEVRDITTNSDWWNAYQYQIPVLARVREDGVEEPLPRLSPRLSAEQVQKKILALLTIAA